MSDSNGNNGRTSFAKKLSLLADSKPFHECVGFAAAEGVSMVVSMGVVGVADVVAPNLLDHASKAVSKTCIEPYLNGIEKGLGTVCKLEECKVDESKSREERAHQLAKTLVVFGAAWALSLAAKFATRRFANNKMGIKDPIITPTGNWFKDKILFKILHPNEWKLGLWDEGVHYGSLLLLNTAAAPVADEMIHGSTNVLTKVGIPEKKAKELSAMAIIWELPNILGAFAGFGVISKKHGHNWGFNKPNGTHVERLDHGGSGPAHKAP